MGNGISVDKRCCQSETARHVFAEMPQPKSEAQVLEGSFGWELGQNSADYGMHFEASGGIIHTDVQCDGCGSHPIVGPRFKSTVKSDYDLCRICFSSVDDESEYIRIDHSVSYPLDVKNEEDDDVPQFTITGKKKKSSKACKKKKKNVEVKHVDAQKEERVEVRPDGVAPADATESAAADTVEPAAAKKRKRKIKEEDERFSQEKLEREMSTAGSITLEEGLLNDNICEVFWKPCKKIRDTEVGKVSIMVEIPWGRKKRKKMVHIWFNMVKESLVDEGNRLGHDSLFGGILKDGLIAHVQAVIYGNVEQISTAHRVKVSENVDIAIHNYLITNGKGMVTIGDYSVQFQEGASKVEVYFEEMGLQDNNTWKKILDICGTKVFGMAVVNLFNEKKKYNGQVKSKRDLKIGIKMLMKKLLYDMVHLMISLESESSSYQPICCNNEQDVTDSKLRSAAYESLNEVVRCSNIKETAQIMRELLLVILLKLSQTLELQIDKGKQADLQASLCGVLQVILSQAAQIMVLFLNVFACRSSTVHEEAMFVIGAVANATGAGFGKYLPEFYKYLELGLQNFQEYQVCSITVGVVGDIVRVMNDQILPYCDGIMQLLLADLSSEALDRSVKPPIFSVFSDIALAIEENFEKYVTYVVPMMQKVAELCAQMDVNDDELMEYGDQLKCSIIRYRISRLQF